MTVTIDPVLIGDYDGDPETHRSDTARTAFQKVNTGLDDLATAVNAGGGGSGDLKADGTVPLTADWDVGAYKITALTFESDVATGTAPFAVASTTQVANLNAATAGNADTVTTNANLTGPVTSVGNATAIADKALAIAKLADGTDGELITWGADGVITTVAVGTATQVLTSNGIGAPPTFEDASGGASPLTTKGDLYTYSTVDARLAVGTNDYVLTADSAEATGMKWAAASGGGFTSFVDDETNGNYAIGLNALDSITVGAGLDNIAIGENAGTGITTGDNNIAIGTNALELATTSNGNIGIGTQVLDKINSTDDYNTAIGYRAITSSSNIDYATALGANALGSSSTGSYTVAIGSGAGKWVGARNTIIGTDALNANGSLSVDNVVIGYAAAQTLNGGDFGVFIGSGVNELSTTDDDQFVVGNGTHNAIAGYFGARSDVDYSAKDLTISGPSAFASASTNQDGGDLVLRAGQPATGGGTAGNVTIADLIWPTADGTANQVIETDGAGNLSFATVSGGFTSFVDDETNGNYAIGLNALDSVTVGGGIGNICIGENAGTALTTGDNSVFIGTDCGKLVNSDGSNVGIGHEAFASSYGLYNLAIGYRALDGNNGDDNVALGKSALGSATSADNSIAIGAGALGTGTHVDESVAVGGNAGQRSDDGCVMIGFQSGVNLTGDYNVCLGWKSGPSSIEAVSYSVFIGPDVEGGSTTDSDQFVVGNSATTVNAIEGYFGARSDLDYSAKDLTITGPSAFASATTNQDGGDLVLQGGQKATGGGTSGKVVVSDLLTVNDVYTVAALPTGAVGDVCRISDGDAALAWGATAINSGAGATPYLIWFNGTNWTIMGK